MSSTKDKYLDSTPEVPEGAKFTQRQKAEWRAGGVGVAGGVGEGERESAFSETEIQCWETIKC